jgi:hypothetical protein
MAVSLLMMMMTMIINIEQQQQLRPRLQNNNCNELNTSHKDDAKVSSLSSSLRPCFFIYRNNSSLLSIL